MEQRKSLARFLPFLSWFGLINRETLKADFTSGLTNAFIVLPQGVAFAMIAGLPPEYGLYTAMIPPIVAALFGSSFHLISGPTTAISIVIFSVVGGVAEPGTPEFIRLTLTLTFLTGAIQLGLGLARMGTLVNFISHTVVVGFTAGAAVLIAASQLKHYFGVEVEKSESFLHNLAGLAAAMPEANPWSALVATVSLAVAIIFKKLWPRLPGMLFAMIAAGLVAWAVGAEEKGIALVGAIPAALPPLSAPDLSFASVNNLFSGALAVSMLGLIEAVSIARSIATKTHQRIDGNQEFVGQGLANIVGSFVSSYASSGSFTRSGLNFSTGARTPVSAIFAGLSLMAIMILFAPLAAYLPIPAMAGIILLVAYGLIDFKLIKDIYKASRQESALLAVTFLATLFVELEFAIYVGVIFSLILYLNQTSKPKVVSRVPDPYDIHRKFTTDPDLPECPQMKILRIDGSIYFGSVFHIQSVLEEIEKNRPEQKHIVIQATGINFIDVAGAELLVNEAERLRDEGGGLYLVGIKDKVCSILRSNPDYIGAVEETRIFLTKEEAMEEITIEFLDHSICRQCGLHVFHECDQIRKGNRVKGDWWERQQNS